MSPHADAVAGLGAATLGAGLSLAEPGVAALGAGLSLASASAGPGTGAGSVTGEPMSREPAREAACA